MNSETELIRYAVLKDNSRTDEEKDAIKYNILQFETQELDVFLENAYIYEKEEIPILSELINSNLPLYKYANSSCMPRGEQSHSTSAPVENINYQRSKELLNIFPGEEKNVMRSKEAANEVEARSMPLPNPSMPSAMDAERTQQSMMPFPEMVIIVNSPNLDN
ncbi:hypothetical protein ACE6H2_008971 [Prunus campanulata]